MGRQPTTNKPPPTWGAKQNAVYPSREPAVLRQLGADADEATVKLVAMRNAFARRWFTSGAKAGRRLLRAHVEHVFQHGPRRGEAHTVRLLEAVFDVVCAKHARLLGPGASATDHRMGVRSELEPTTTKWIATGRLRVAKGVDGARDCLAWFAARKATDDTHDFVTAMDADAHQAATGWGPKGKGNAPSAC